ncbi:hypothetical protein CDAR_87161 [Caerostris darwini]|uniref:Uncharacterized protein n=2 Tax=Caerostris TaxID=172845 RepID=A0AAV4U810_9ARAC|nr:hypothetical protein CDAR_87161 [Caerostris darwini]GIY73040.1 hypothetical protein CEXT_43131 [Caerostris extrusa]
MLIKWVQVVDVGMAAHSSSLQFSIQSYLKNPPIKMKAALIILCLAVASCTALPTGTQQASILDFLKDLEDTVREDGKLLIGKMINVLHTVESTVLRLRDLVPKVHDKIHQEIDELLAGIKKASDEIQELLGKQKALHGFDLLGSLTELSGGTKLSTVLSILSLADKAHKVMEDAKQFVPKLETTLNKMQTHVEGHAHDFASHVLKELGLQDVVQMSIVKKIEDLFFKVEEEAHILMLDLMHKMEQTFDILKEKLPAEYEKVKDEVAEVRNKIHELVSEVEKSLVMRSFSLLDLAGNVTGGTSMSTVFKVMSLVDKFNKVVQDVRTFGPKAEEVLQHSVKKVADSAQDFFSHASDKLLQ